MCEGSEIGGFIVGGAVAPADEHNPLLFEGESAHGAAPNAFGVTAGDLLLEEEPGGGQFRGRR